MENRGFSVGGKYRYGFNTQEQEPELGSGVTSAEFWMYDGKLGRRWNVDPIYNADISRYSVNGNNPLYYLDPKGDFRSKFGAKWYRLRHGIKGEVTQNTDAESKRNGEWYIQKREGNSKKGNGKELLDEIHIYSRIYGHGDTKKGKYSSGDPLFRDPSPSIDELADAAGVFLNRGIEYSRQNASHLWNSPVARAIIPDYYTVSGNFQASSGIYLNEEFTFTLMLRGKDPGLYFNTTTGFGGVSSVGGDVGCSVGKGYYNGDARKLSSSMLGGWQGSASVGVGFKAIAGPSINGGVDVGVGPDGQITTVTGKVGVSVGVGVSTPVLQGGVGVGKATNAIPIVKFKID